MTQKIQNLILIMRGKRVMLDSDLARLYEVSTKALNQSVQRNLDRFPKEFMFKLSKSERDEVVTKCDHLASLKYSYSLPSVFTEHGVAMLSSVLKSKRAIQVNIQIIKAFIRIKHTINSYETLRRKIVMLENKVDRKFSYIFSAIHGLMESEKKSLKKIGFM